MKLDSFVIAHLSQPREKIWGRLKTLSEAGITLRGIDVAHVERYKYQVTAEHPEIHPQTVFFPMHRVIKIEADESMGSVPSLIETVTAIGRVAPDRIFREPTDSITGS